MLHENSLYYMMGTEKEKGYGVETQLDMVQFYLAKEY